MCISQLNPYFWNIKHLTKTWNQLCPRGSKRTVRFLEKQPLHVGEKASFYLQISHEASCLFFLNDLEASGLQSASPLVSYLAVHHQRQESLPISHKVHVFLLEDISPEADGFRPRSLLTKLRQNSALFISHLSWLSAIAHLTYLSSYLEMLFSFWPSCQLWHLPGKP